MYRGRVESDGEVDEVLGRLGGVFHGTVIEFAEGAGFFIADAWWIPPEGEPIGQWRWK